MNLYLDIETIGTSDPAVIERVTASIKPPANYKKPEAIEKWWAEDGGAAKQEAVARTAFDGTYGRIVCIGYAFDNGTVKTVCGVNESSLIQEFYSEVSTHSEGRSMNVVGHNVVAFDLKFLWQRSVVNGIRPPACLNFKVKPWDSADTMTMWNTEKRISLDNLCAALKIPTPKGEMGGSKVGQAFADGKYQEIADYCAGDVEAVRQCYRKMTFAA